MEWLLSRVPFVLRPILHVYSTQWRASLFKPFYLCAHDQYYLNRLRLIFRRFAVFVIILPVVNSLPPFSTCQASGMPEMYKKEERLLKIRPGDRHAAQKIFANSLITIKKVLKKMAEGSGKTTVMSKDSEEITALRKSIRAADRALHWEFAEIEKRCIVKGFSTTVRARHRKMVENHEKNMNILVENLDTLEDALNSGNEALFQEIIERIDTHLKKSPVRIDPPILSGESLDRQAQTTVLKTQPESESNDPSSEAPSSRRMPMALVTGAALTPLSNDFPAEQDLAPTIDVQITQDIKDLAAGLDHCPFKMYEHVRNNFDYEPYVGSWKGSQETLRQGCGNNADLSSLLIALLRASGIPARYATAVFYLPPERALKLLGVESLDALDKAPAFANHSHDENGDVVNLKFQHVWVEGFIPYANYRGIPLDQTGRMWVPMDPSFKEYNWQPGIDILSEMNFDSEVFVEEYISTFQEISPYESFFRRVFDHLSDVHPELSYEKIIYQREIVKETFGFIPGSLAFDLSSMTSPEREVSSELPLTIPRTEVCIAISDAFGFVNDLEYRTSLPEILGKRITLSYAAATQEDQDVIDSYGGLYNTPPHLIKMKEVLRIDGLVVAVGDHPEEVSWNIVKNLTVSGLEDLYGATQIAVGASAGLAIGFTKIAPESLRPQISETGFDEDSWNGERLWHTAMTYLDRSIRSKMELQKLTKVIDKPQVGLAVVADAVFIIGGFEIPYALEWKGLFMDVDSGQGRSISVDGDPLRERTYAVLMGAVESSLENRIFEDMYDAEAVSTIKILQLANDMGIPICRVTTSLEADCPSFSWENVGGKVYMEVQDAVSDGRHVIVPERFITYLEWRGIGWIARDPETGRAGYFITGGYKGGYTAGEAGSDPGSPPGPMGHGFPPPPGSCDPVFSIISRITYPAEGEYFPELTPESFLTSENKNLYFEVAFTESDGCGSVKTYLKKYRPGDPYPAGKHSWEYLGERVNFTVFGVEIETPDGDVAIEDCGEITLQAKVIPEAPPSLNLLWDLNICSSACGQAVIHPLDTPETALTGILAGDRTIILSASNENGQAVARKDILINERINIVGIIAEDQDKLSRSVTDSNAGVEAVRTLYVPRKDSGSVDIRVETEPRIAEDKLPSMWKIEKISGSLDFEGPPGKLTTSVRKNTAGDIVVKVKGCAGDTEHFQVRVVPFTIDFTTPDGDPVAAPKTTSPGQNEFTFNNANPGVLDMGLEAHVHPSGVAVEIAKDVSFEVDAVGTSMMNWNAANPGGKAFSIGDNLLGDVSFTGLPQKNSDFGRKQVRVVFDDEIVDTQHVEIFFPKDGTNHPGPGAGTVPNWFFYWNEGDVCGINRNNTTTYDATLDYGEARPGYWDFTIRIGPYAADDCGKPEWYDSGDLNYPPVLAGGEGKGIKCVAVTLQHEMCHYDNYNRFHHLLAKEDFDKDGIPDFEEEGYMGIRTDPRNPDTYRLGLVIDPSYSTYGDEELRCRKAESPLTIKIYPERDWANPGCQSAVKFGP